MMTAPSSDRVLHIVDVENFLGGWVTADRVERFWKRYEAVVGIGPADHAFVGCAVATAAAVMFGTGSRARLIVGGRGKNAADKAVLGLLDGCHLGSRYWKAYVGSGDRSFSAIAGALQRSGCQVVNVSSGPPSLRFRMLQTSHVRVSLRPRIPAA